jgi:uncharacterized protein (TIGR02996 family)
MDQATLPSDVARQLAAALDDNFHAPVPVLLQFELALANNPADRATRQVYHDWLLEHGCTRRAAELARQLADAGPPEYTGPVRPPAGTDWAGL